jgi:hypothetical protein
MALRKIEADPQTFLASIKGWDGQSPAFEDVVLTGVTLSILYGGGSILLIAIANACRVNYHAVREWATGEAVPDPRWQPAIVEAIRHTLDDHIRAYDAYVLRNQPTSHVRRASREIAAVSNE